MKVALLSGGSTVHTVRWANGLAQAGLQVSLLTQHAPRDRLDRSVEVMMWPERGNRGYFLMAPAVRGAIHRIKPDVLNAHYASGYGTTARLVGFRPYVLSVWGGDVYEFSERSRVHRYWLRENLMHADLVASTSHCMARQTRSIAPGLGEIHITPFGVDLDAFATAPRPSTGGNASLVIGTVKTMHATYGIDTLIEAFALLKKRLVAAAHPMAGRIVLRLVGDGPQTECLKALARSLGVSEAVTFVGRVPHSKVPSELGKLDIYVALSRQESFGVAVIEAGAAGRPVVVSDAGGLPEVVRDGITGIVVPRDDPPAAADAIWKLVLSPSDRIAMGEAGRRNVEEQFAWDHSVQTMISVYEKAIASGAQADRKSQGI